MNRRYFSNFSSNVNFSNNPCVGEIAFDPITEKVFIYTGKRWVYLEELASRPYIPVTQIHSGICPSCGGAVSPSALKCDFCGRYFDFGG